MPDKRRIAIIGLGMAVTPHARSLVDLARARRGRLCLQPQRGAPAGASRRSFDFPLTDSLEPIAGDASVDAVMHPDPARHPSRAGPPLRRRRQAHPPGEAAGALDRARRGPGEGGGGRRRQARRGLPAPLPRGLAGARGRGSSRASSATLAAANVICPWWRPQSYYDEPGRGTLARDGGGVLITQAIHTLDLLLSLTGPVAEVRGDLRHHRPAPHGDRGLRRRRPALRERRARRAARHDRRLPWLRRSGSS